MAQPTTSGDFILSDNFIADQLKLATSSQLFNNSDQLKLFTSSQQQSQLQQLQQELQQSQQELQQSEQELQQSQQELQQLQQELQQEQQPQQDLKTKEQKKCKKIYQERRKIFEKCLKMYKKRWNYSGVPTEEQWNKLNILRTELKKLRKDLKRKYLIFKYYDNDSYDEYNEVTEIISDSLNDYMTLQREILFGKADDDDDDETVDRDNFHIFLENSDGEEECKDDDVKVKFYNRQTKKYLKPKKYMSAAKVERLCKNPDKFFAKRARCLTQDKMLKMEKRYQRRFNFKRSLNEEQFKKLEIVREQLKRVREFIYWEKIKHKTLPIMTDDHAERSEIYFETELMPFRTLQKNIIFYTKRIGWDDRTSEEEYLDECNTTDDDEAVDWRDDWEKKDEEMSAIAEHIEPRLFNKQTKKMVYRKNNSPPLFPEEIEEKF